MLVQFLLRAVVRGVVAVCLPCALAAIAGCTRGSVQDAAAIPDLSDWSDCGEVLEAGAAGEWDYYLWGGFAASVMKKAGRYWLYYQGSDGYDDIDGTVTHRAIGLATSLDGVRFTKHRSNPILRFSPNGHHEEGAVSSAVLVDASDAVVMYYGANTWTRGDQVSADGRVAVSPDGVNFADRGVILDHRDRQVWGYGDELFPIIAFRHGDRRVIYYIPNGSSQRGQLGVAWADGTGPYQSSAATQSGKPLSVWGPGSAVRLNGNVYALFLSNSQNSPYMEVRLVTAAAPARLSVPVRRYRWDDIRPAAVMRDDEQGVWFLYYRRADGGYGVMIASSPESTTSGDMRALCGS